MECIRSSYGENSPTSELKGTCLQAASTVTHARHTIAVGQVSAHGLRLNIAKTFVYRRGVRLEIFQIFDQFLDGEGNIALGFGNADDALLHQLKNMLRKRSSESSSCVPWVLSVRRNRYLWSVHTMLPGFSSSIAS